MIVVVEPHADDAYLSLGAHIERWAKEGERVLVATVHSGTRKRGAEAEAYAHAVGADWLGLGYVERGDGVTGDVAVEFDRPFDLPEGRLIFPLGVRHPEHRAVRAQAPEGAEFYVETPYQIVAANSTELMEKLAGRRIVSWLHPGARKWRHHGLFKDQSMFMFQNPPSRLANAPEVIVQ